jgi:hypothetical protein
MYSSWENIVLKCGRFLCASWPNFLFSAKVSAILLSNRLRLPLVKGNLSVIILTLVRMQRYHVIIIMLFVYVAVFGFVSYVWKYVMNSILCWSTWIQSISLNSASILILFYTLRIWVPIDLFPSRFSTKVVFLISRIPGTYSVHLILLDLSL